MVEVNGEKHIHTLGCSSDPRPCDPVIKHDYAVGQVLQNPKTSVNNSEENQLPHTYGYKIKRNRIEAGLDRSHINDAFVISGGNGQERCRSFDVKQVRRDDRSIQTNRKGFGPSIRRRRYGLQPNDLIGYDDKEHRVKGVHCLGSRVVLDNKRSIAVSKVELIKHGKGLCCM